MQEYREYDIQPGRWEQANNLKRKTSRKNESISRACFLSRSLCLSKCFLVLSFSRMSISYSLFIYFVFHFHLQYVCFFSLFSTLSCFISLQYSFFFYNSVSLHFLFRALLVSFSFLSFSFLQTLTCQETDLFCFFQFLNVCFSSAFFAC